MILEFCNRKKNETWFQACFISQFWSLVGPISRLEFLPCAGEFSPTHISCQPQWRGDRRGQMTMPPARGLEGAPKCWRGATIASQQIKFAVLKDRILRILIFYQGQTQCTLRITVQFTIFTPTSIRMAFRIRLTSAFLASKLRYRT